ncbi:hypothetical protein F5887DRAFT_212977 [Amanita rubescens]|nr:hypothetical protein F5887DRAFT_212977 [Amanita rubescens]
MTLSTSSMEDLSFLERLALLPQFDAEQRTAAHVQGQKSYAKLYASEGRTYMSSWRQGDGTHSGEENKSPVNKPADIDIGTPVLKPRVEKPANSVEPSKAEKLKATTKTVITVESSNLNEKDQKKRTTTKSKKTADATAKSKEKTVPPKKKRVVEESPSESSRAERLKERRERKRKKRAIVEPQTSDKENDKNESRRQTRTRNKKMPAGFALMHGFAATNVGKERLTIKPPVNIGVFSKGKASAKTKAVKTKVSGKRDLHMDGYFSESKFLNKSKREIVPPDRSSSDEKMSTSSRGLEERESPKRAENVSKAERVPNKKVIEATSSPARISSVVWDIELGKSLCKDDCSAPDTQKKQGSIVLNTSRHAWARVAREGDAEKKGATVPSRDGSEAPSTIGPSQSVSQRIVKVSPAKPIPDEETHSKYFQARTSPIPKVQEKATTEPLASLCSFNESSIDIVQVPMIEDLAEDTMCLGNVLEQNGDCDTMPEFMQKEFEINEYIPADPSLEVGDQDVHFEEKSLSYAEDDNQRDLAIFNDGYQDLQIDDDFFLQPGYDEALHIDRASEEVRKQISDEYASFPDEFELDGCLQEGDTFHDYFNDAAGRGNLEMEEICDYSQNGNMPENDCIYDDEQSVNLDHDQAFESVNGTDDDSNEELEELQTDRFSQGRALLFGRSGQGKQRATSSHLTSAEVDVVKRLRDHWLPQKL